MKRMMHARFQQVPNQIPRVAVLPFCRSSLHTTQHSNQCTKTPQKQSWSLIVRSNSTYPNRAATRIVSHGRPAPAPIWKLRFDTVSSEFATAPRR